MIEAQVRTAGHNLKCCFAGMAPALRGLPVPRIHQHHRVQSYRRHAFDALAEDAMATRSVISPAILGLVIARAVNVFT